MTFGLSRLTAARLWVISAPVPGKKYEMPPPCGQAYLSQALFALQPVPCEAVARMTVDEKWRLYVNLAWLDATDVPEIGRELAKCVWHLLDKHAERARAVGVTTDTAARWRLAAESVLCDMLFPSGLRAASLPEFPSEAWGEPVEAFFAQLPTQPTEAQPTEDDEDDDPLDEGGSGVDGIPRSYELRDANDLPKVTRLDAEAIRRGVADDFRSSGGGQFGDGPSPWVERWARKVADPRVPWQQVLAGAVRRAVSIVAGSGDYSYRRPSRRNASVPNVVLPSRVRPVPEIAVIIDTSGSMSEDELGRAVTELDSIITSMGLGDRGLTAISVDTSATSMWVRRAADIALVGGGGTDMSIGLAAAAQLRPRPEVAIVLTDGYTPWPNAPIPGMSVIATLLGCDPEELPPTPDWMARVECTEGDD